MSHKDLEYYRQAIESNIGDLILSKLKEEKVKDIMLNENGYLFEERIGEGFNEIGEMNPREAEAFLLSVAAYMGRDLNYYSPRLRGSLPKEKPFHGERIEAQIYPIVEAPTFAIRKPMIKIVELEDYVNSGQMTRAQLKAVDIAIENRDNIVIVGGTGSGKTTLANALVSRITKKDHKCRLYVLQDAREIISDYKNATFPITTESLNMNDLLESGMRYNPTRLIVGELLGKEAFTFLNACNTGHRGAVTTIHANSPREGLTRFVSLLETHGYSVNPVDIAEKVNVLIFIEREIGIPTIKSIGIVQGYNSANKEFLVNDKLYGS